MHQNEAVSCATAKSFYSIGPCCCRYCKVSFLGDFYFQVYLLFQNNNNNNNVEERISKITSIGSFRVGTTCLKCHCFCIIVHWNKLLMLFKILGQFVFPSKKFFTTLITHMGSNQCDQKKIAKCLQKLPKMILQQQQLL